MAIPAYGNPIYTLIPVEHEVPTGFNATGGWLNGKLLFTKISTLELRVSGFDDATGEFIDGDPETFSEFSGDTFPFANVEWAAPDVIVVYGMNVVGGFPDTCLVNAYSVAADMSLTAIGTASLDKDSFGGGTGGITWGFNVVTGDVIFYKTVTQTGVNPKTQYHRSVHVDASSVSSFGALTSVTITHLDASSFTPRPNSADSILLLRSGSAGGAPDEAFVTSYPGSSTAMTLSDQSEFPDINAVPVFSGYDGVGPLRPDNLHYDPTNTVARILRIDDDGTVSVEATWPDASMFNYVDIHPELVEENSGYVECLHYEDDGTVTSAFGITTEDGNTGYPVMSFFANSMVERELLGLGRLDNENVPNVDFSGTSPEGALLTVGSIYNADYSTELGKQMTAWVPTVPVFWRNLVINPSGEQNYNKAWGATNGTVETAVTWEV